MSARHPPVKPIPTTTNPPEAPPLLSSQPTLEVKPRFILRISDLTFKIRESRVVLQPLPQSLEEKAMENFRHELFKDYSFERLTLPKEN